MKNIFVIFLLLGSLHATGQYRTATPSAAGAGDASVTLHDVNSLFSNQAGLAHVEKFGILAFAERRFLLSELQTVAAGAVLPVQSGAFGLTVQSFGFEGFRQQKMGLAYARSFSDNFSAGVQFDYFQTRIPEYGAKGAITFEGGLLASLTKDLLLGVHVFGPAHTEFAPGEEFPVVFRMGAGYQPSEKVTLLLEAEKDLDFPLRVKGGAVYQPADAIFIRLGFGTQPAAFTLGAGFVFSDRLRADVSGSYQSMLGYSPSAGITFSK